jgi:tRNA pseudouridine38-40 synthase
VPALRRRPRHRQARLADLRADERLTGFHAQSAKDTKVSRTVPLIPTSPSRSRTLKLTVEYDGTDYVGWQRQPEGVSIQGLLEDALARIEGAAVTVHGAGRTDAGVHALAQSASVTLTATLDATTVQRALNAVLPLDVRVRAVAEMPDGFHARFSAVSKTYEYRVANASFVSAFLHRYAWHVPQALDHDAMRSGAALLRGQHDFASFQATGTPVPSTVRTIDEIEWRPGGGPSAPAVLHVRGDGFLRHMVRAIAGTLVDVGVGRWPPGEMATILDARDRGAAGRSAPPHGLFLVAVGYPESLEPRP